MTGLVQELRRVGGVREDSAKACGKMMLEDVALRPDTETLVAALVADRTKLNHKLPYFGTPGLLFALHDELASLSPAALEHLVDSAGQRRAFGDGGVASESGVTPLIAIWNSGDGSCQLRSGNQGLIGIERNSMLRPLLRDTLATVPERDVEMEERWAAEPGTGPVTWLQAKALLQQANVDLYPSATFQQAQLFRRVVIVHSARLRHGPQSPNCGVFYPVTQEAREFAAKHPAPPLQVFVYESDEGDWTAVPPRLPRLHAVLLAPVLRGSASLTFSLTDSAGKELPPRFLKPQEKADYKLELLMEQFCTGEAVKLPSGRLGWRCPVSPSHKPDSVEVWERGLAQKLKSRSLFKPRPDALGLPLRPTTTPQGMRLSEEELRALGADLAEYIATQWQPSHPALATEPQRTPAHWYRVRHPLLLCGAGAEAGQRVLQRLAARFQVPNGCSPAELVEALVRGGGLEWAEGTRRGPPGEQPPPVAAGHPGPQSGQAGQPGFSPIGWAQTLADPINFQGIQFAQNLIKRYFSEPSQSCLSQTDLRLSIEASGKIGGAYGGSGRAVDGSLASVLEMIRSDEAEASGTAAQGQAQSGPSSQPVGGQKALPLGGVTLKGREAGPGDEESAELQQKAEAILRDWLPMAYMPTYVKEPSKAFSLIIQTMHQHGILRTDDMITRFFKLYTEMCVDLSYRLLKDPANQHHMQMVRGRCFYTLDAYVKLISILVKHSGDGAFATKINLLNKVLGVIAQTLVQDQQVRGTEFHQLPYHRLLIMLFWELTTPDPLLDPINFQILTSFCNTLHMLQPPKVPDFAYAWLDMVGHRAFVGRMLVVTPQQKAWPMYAQLLIDHLKFLAPFLRNIDLPRPIALMYKGTLRVLLVVLHDFPDLLVEYGYLLCDVIPPNCVQLRNLVLSAYPPHLRLPDPFMPGLKVEKVPEIQASPPIFPCLPQLLGPLKTPLDEYLTNRMPVSFLYELPSKLKASDPSLFNALVVYLGSAAIGALRDKEELPSPNNIAHSSYMDVFQSLAVNLDTEGRYLFFNAIANQLRYPNSHTQS